MCNLGCCVNRRSFVKCKYRFIMQKLKFKHLFLVDLLVVILLVGILNNEWTIGEVNAKEYRLNRHRQDFQILQRDGDDPIPDPDPDFETSTTVKPERKTTPAQKTTKVPNNDDDDDDGDRDDSKTTTKKPKPSETTVKPNDKTSTTPRPSEDKTTTTTTTTSTTTTSTTTTSTTTTTRRPRRSTTTRRSTSTTTSTTIDPDEDETTTTTTSRPDEDTTTTSTTTTSTTTTTTTSTTRRPHRSTTTRRPHRSTTTRRPARITTEQPPYEERLSDIIPVPYKMARWMRNIGPAIESMVARKTIVLKVEPLFCRRSIADRSYYFVKAKVTNLNERRPKYYHLQVSSRGGGAYWLHAVRTRHTAVDEIKFIHPFDGDDDEDYG